MDGLLLAGPFASDPRIADPRGLSVGPSGALIYVNSGDYRVLVLDLRGHMVRDSGPMAVVSAADRRGRPR